MIEVVADGAGYYWAMLSEAGRELMRSVDHFPDNKEAALAAKEYRLEFWARSARIDYYGCCAAL